MNNPSLAQIPASELKAELRKRNAVRPGCVGCGTSMRRYRFDAAYCQKCADPKAILAAIMFKKRRV